ncbi:MAG: AMP-binding protein, partial [bacterium]|nr:AMP-binding protein [bacterium]
KGTVIAALTGDRLELITQLLGILETGSVFMPIDPNQPVKRIRQMLEITAAPFMIADTANHSRLLHPDSGIDEKTIEILKPERDFAQTPPGSPHPATARADDMIYIYFTSGTTGVPKAIAGKNKSLRHFIQWEIETFDISEGTRGSQFTTPGFDAILRDVFVPLCSGGTVCIPGSAELSDSWKLIDWID